MGDVSVVTAAFNAGQVIERNIRAVAAQQLLPKEHIIVDDGSVDETVSVVQRLQDEIPHVRLIEQPNRGAGMARNAGIEAADGRYIAFLDSDDLWSEQKLKSQVEFMEKNSAVFTYGEYRSVDAETGADLGIYEAPPELRYPDLLRGCPIGCLTVAYDRAALGKRYMPDVRRGHDWGLWLELTRDGAVATRFPGCHATYYRSKSSLSSAKFQKSMDIFRIYREQEKFGLVRTFSCLVPHVLSAMTKRPAK